jgi:hypothetical protein
MRVLQLQNVAGGSGTQMRSAHLLVVSKEADVAVAGFTMPTQYRPVPGSAAQTSSTAVSLSTDLSKCSLQFHDNDAGGQPHEEKRRQ